MIRGAFAGQRWVALRTTTFGEMMPNFVKKYQCKGVRPQSRVKGQPPVDADDAPVFQLERLRIDYSEIQMKLECQLGKRLPKIFKQRFQQVLATARLCLK